VVQIVAEVQTLQFVAHAVAVVEPDAKKYPVAAELAVQVLAAVQAVQLGQAIGVLVLAIIKYPAEAVVHVLAAEQAEHPVILHAVATLLTK